MANIPTDIRVVCVALIDGSGRVLLQKRRAGSRHGGLWEFPGGKVEPGESRKTTLVRKIDEEPAIAVVPGDLRREDECTNGPEGKPPLVLISLQATSNNADFRLA